jgi:hypothetical protein
MKSVSVSTNHVKARAEPTLRMYYHYTSDNVGLTMPNVTYILVLQGS